MYFCKGDNSEDMDVFIKLIVSIAKNTYLPHESLNFKTF